MATLLYIVDWLPPDFGAVGQYAVLEAQERAEAGDRVILVGLSSERSSRTHEEFGSGSVTMIRLKRPPVPKSNFRARAVWTLMTNFVLTLRSLPWMFRADEILFTGSPPFLEHLLIPLNLVLRRNVVFRIADFHPECLMAEMGSIPRPLALFHRLTIAIRRRVPSFQVLGEDQRALLEAQGVKSDRISLKRSDSPISFQPEDKPLGVPADLAGHGILLYSGNVAFAHDYETFVEGYARHHESSGKMHLWLNAVGVRADAFEQAVRDRGLPIYRTKGVELSELASLLLTADCHLITLRDEFVGLCVPCKVYACVESGRPTLFVGSDGSDVHLIAQSRTAEGSYFRAEIGHPEQVFEALEALGRRVVRDRQERQLG